MELARESAVEAVSRLVHKDAENVVMHTPPTTVPSPPFCLSSLHLPETFPGQDIGRSSNGSPREVINSLEATVCTGHGLISVLL